MRIALLVLGIASSGAIAQSEPVAPEPANAPAPAAAAAGDDIEDQEIVVEGEVPKEKRRVCETRVQTGSIMPKRVCRTVAQAEEEREAAHEAMERISRDRETRTLVQEINGVGAP
jgi:hypothetical protein